MSSNLKVIQQPLVNLQSSYKDAPKKPSKRKLIVKIAALILIAMMLLSLGGCDEKTISADGTILDQTDSVLETLVSLLGSKETSVQIIALITILSLAPSILMMFTCFTRIIITLSFTKNALGMQQMPPSAVLVGLAIILTFYIMAPVADQIKTQAYDPYINDEITSEEAAKLAIEPVKTFMLKQVFVDDLDMFLTMAGIEELNSVEDTPMYVLTPAFITSEIKRGFMIGFFIYIPFIVVDMIVASVLMSMGMMMLPPTVISLPFKVLLFVVVDGWTLTIKTLITTFGTL